LEGHDGSTQAKRQAEAREAAMVMLSHVPDAGSQRQPDEDPKLRQDIEAQKQLEIKNRLSVSEKKAAVKKAAAKKVAAKAKPPPQPESEPSLPDEDEATSEKTLGSSQAPPRRFSPRNAREREVVWQGWSREEKLAYAGSLVKAVEKGNFELIKRLVNEGVNTNARDQNGESPLYMAGKKGSTVLLEFLISDCGASINCTTAQRETALHAACKYDKKDAVEWLVTRGIKTQAKNKNGEMAADVVTGETAKSELLKFKTQQRYSMTH
jgi:ankyrin repeat protein